MKETALAKQYIDILSIAKESADAQKLLNYRAPHAAKQVTTPPRSACINTALHSIIPRVYSGTSK